MKLLQFCYEFFLWHFISRAFRNFLTFDSNRRRGSGACAVCSRASQLAYCALVSPTREHIKLSSVSFQWNKSTPGGLGWYLRYVYTSSLHIINLWYILTGKGTSWRKGKVPTVSIERWAYLFCQLYTYGYKIFKHFHKSIINVLMQTVVTYLPTVHVIFKF